MNAVVSEKINTTEEVKAAIPTPTDDERQKRIAAMKAKYAERIAQRIEEGPLSKEERLRRGKKLMETMKQISEEARARGLTDEILEDLLKDI